MFVIVILYFLYKKQYKSIFGLLYLLLCILVSGYFFIGFENDSFRFSDTESMNLKQFLKFLFGWILLYLPYLLLLLIILHAPLLHQNILSIFPLIALAFTTKFLNGNNLGNTSFELYFLLGEEVKIDNSFLLRFFNDLFFIKSKSLISPRSIVP